MNTQYKADQLSSKCLYSVPKLKACCGDALCTNLKLHNDGKIAWPKDVSLSCLDVSAIKGMRTPLRVKIEPGRDINVDVNFKTTLPEGEYLSYWQLVNNMDNSTFGEIIKFEITLEKKEIVEKPKIYIPPLNLRNIQPHIGSSPFIQQQSRVSNSNSWKQQQFNAREEDEQCYDYIMPRKCMEEKYSNMK
jgi:hypothetical protein